MADISDEDDEDYCPSDAEEEERKRKKEERKSKRKKLKEDRRKKQELLEEEERKYIRFLEKRVRVKDSKWEEFERTPFDFKTRIVSDEEYLKNEKVHKSQGRLPLTKVKEQLSKFIKFQKQDNFTQTLTQYSSQKLNKILRQKGEYNSKVMSYQRGIEQLQSQIAKMNEHNARNKKIQEDAKLQNQKAIGIVIAPPKVSFYTPEQKKKVADKISAYDNAKKVFEMKIGELENEPIYVNSIRKKKNLLSLQEEYLEMLRRKYPNDEHYNEFSTTRVYYNPLLGVSTSVRENVVRERKLEDTKNEDEPPKKKRKLEEIKIEENELVKEITMPKIEEKENAHKTKNFKFSNLDNVIKMTKEKRESSTVQKSRDTWEIFKVKEKIKEDVEYHAKDGYLEKQDFLQRTDLREFERSKNIRNIERRLMESKNKPKQKM